MMKYIQQEQQKQQHQQQIQQQIHGSIDLLLVALIIEASSLTGNASHMSLQMQCGIN